MESKVQSPKSKGRGYRMVPLRTFVKTFAPSALDSNRRGYHSLQSNPKAAKVRKGRTLDFGLFFGYDRR